MQVCEAIGKFTGELMEIDENNFKVSRPAYLRVRTLIGSNKPIKRRMRLRINEGSNVMIQLQYERLPPMCLICGTFDHTEASCPLTYVAGQDQPKQMYDQSIRATLRQNMITEKDQWLRDENGCSYVPTGSVLKAK